MDYMNSIIAARIYPAGQAAPVNASGQLLDSQGRVITDMNGNPLTVSATTAQAPSLSGALIGGVNTLGQIVDTAGHVLTDAAGNALSIVSPGATTVQTTPASTAKHAMRMGWAGMLITGLVVYGVVYAGAYYGAKRGVKAA